MTLNISGWTSTRVRPAEGWCIQWESSPPREKSEPCSWIVGRKETESRKSIDKTILGVMSRSTGCNESERTGGLENMHPRGRAFLDGAKAAWNVAI
jgi:hypothetical protein